jgi:ceramide glucosyltransferase
VVLNFVLGALAFLSAVLLLWQYIVAIRFPLHQRLAIPSDFPPVTLLKPLKGSDSTTKDSLRSWFTQDYSGPTQILFGVASASDSVCAIVRELMSECAAKDAQLLICAPLAGANAKVSKLVEMERSAKHDILVISDADVSVPCDFLANLVVHLSSSPGREGMGEGNHDFLQPPTQPTRDACLHQPTVLLQAETGLVNCFYRLANASTPAMQWEAVAINADFWSQVLQAQSLKPLDFAMGAVMATRKKQLAEIGGFAALADCLADDYQLGNRIAKKGYRIAISTVPVECWSEPMSWAAVWKHQLRWARTIRVCQPLPYFFSILSNPTLWPLLWLAIKPSAISLGFALVCFLLRIASARNLQQRLSQPRITHLSSVALLAKDDRASGITFPVWMPILKDLLQTAIWLLAFVGNHIEWRGQRMRLRPDGTLVKPQNSS